MDQRTERNRRPPGVAALVGQEPDAGRCSGPILNFLTTFQYLVLNFVSTFLIFGPRLPLYFSLLAPRLFLDLSHLFSSLALVVLKFLSRKLTTFRSFPEGSCEVVVAPPRKS